MICNRPGRGGLKRSCGSRWGMTVDALSVRSNGRSRVAWRPWALLVAPIALGGCEPAVLAPAGPVGLAEKTILLDSVAIMLVIVVPTIVATLGFAWWYRASNRRARYRPDWAYSGRVELITWAIPLLTITLLGGVTWVGSHLLDPGRPIESAKPPLDVEVVALDWKWLFIYPQQRIASVNALSLPVGVPVRFTMTSASVLNAFFIPRLGSMIYVMNGMTSRLNLLVDTPGQYSGLSSHYSGDGFSDMNFTMRAMAPDQFARWVDASRRSGPTLDEAAYTALERQSKHVAPMMFAAADPALFGRIVSQELPPASGPEAARAHNDVTPRTD